MIVNISEVKNLYNLEKMKLDIHYKVGKIGK